MKKLRASRIASQASATTTHPGILAGTVSVYSQDELLGMLGKAKTLGYSLAKGSQLEKLTIRELDVLVNRKM